jgi:hypothetical protein
MAAGAWGQPYGADARPSSKDDVAQDALERAKGERAERVAEPANH